LRRPRGHKRRLEDWCSRRRATSLPRPTARNGAIATIPTIYFQPTTSRRAGRIMVDGDLGCRSPAQRLAWVAVLSAGPLAGPFPPVGACSARRRTAACRCCCCSACVGAPIRRCVPATLPSASVAQPLCACNAAITASEDAGPGGTGAASSGESESVGRDMESWTHAPSSESSLDQPPRATWAVTGIQLSAGRTNSAWSRLLPLHTERSDG
jgi:hypothetical protein